MTADPERGHDHDEDPSYGEWLWERLLGHPEPDDIGDPIDDDVGCAGPGLPASRIREAQERCEAELALDRTGSESAGDPQQVEAASKRGPAEPVAAGTRILQVARDWCLAAGLLIALALAAAAWQVWDGTHSLDRLPYDEAFAVAFDSTAHMDTRMVALALIQYRIGSVCEAARELPDHETLEVLARIAADLPVLNTAPSAPRPRFGVSIEILLDSLHRRPLDSSERARLDELVRAGIRALGVATRLPSELDGRTAYYLDRAEAALLDTNSGR